MHLIIRHNNIYGPDGFLNGSCDIKPYMNWMGWGISQPLDGSYHNEQEYIWFGVGIWTVSDILGLLWSEVGGACPRGTLLNPFSKLHIHIYHIPQILEQSVQSLLRPCPDKIWVEFGLPPGDPLSSPVWILKHFCKFHIHLSISILSPNFRTMRLVVTENSIGQNVGGKKKKMKKKT